MESEYCITKSTNNSYFYLCRFMHKDLSDLPSVLQPVTTIYLVHCEFLTADSSDLSVVEDSVVFIGWREGGITPPPICLKLKESWSKSQLCYKRVGHCVFRDLFLSNSSSSMVKTPLPSQQKVFQYISD